MESVHAGVFQVEVHTTEQGAVADFVELERKLISSLKESIEVELEGKSESEVRCTEFSSARCNRPCAIKTRG